MLLPDEIVTGDKVLVSFFKDRPEMGKVWDVRKAKGDSVYLRDPQTKEIKVLVYNKNPEAEYFYGHVGWYDPELGNDARKADALAWVYKPDTSSESIDALHKGEPVTQIIDRLIS